MKKKTLIRQCADAMMKFTERIWDMDAKQLKALIKQCDSLTQTNCWWLEYRIAPLLKQEAQEAMFLLLRAKTETPTNGIKSGRSTRQRN